MGSAVVVPWESYTMIVLGRLSLVNQSNHTGRAFLGRFSRRASEPGLQYLTASS
jgi:hypothetical protein